MKLETLRNEYRDDILSLASKYGMENIRIFGSVAHGNSNDDSDVDLLVHPQEGRDLFDLGGFYHEVGELLPCKVDIVPDTGDIYFPDILKDALPL